MTAFRAAYVFMSRQCLWDSLAVLSIEEKWRYASCAASFRLCHDAAKCAHCMFIATTIENNPVALSTRLSAELGIVHSCHFKPPAFALE